MKYPSKTMSWFFSETKNIGDGITACDQPMKNQLEKEGKKLRTETKTAPWSDFFKEDLNILLSSLFQEINQFPEL